MKKITKRDCHVVHGGFSVHGKSLCPDTELKVMSKLYERAYNMLMRYGLAEPKLYMYDALSYVISKAVMTKEIKLCP